MAFTFSLTCDGSSDRMLMPILQWVLEQNTAVPFGGVWADPAVFVDANRDVETRIRQTILFYPSDILFVHRDAETIGFEARTAEIEEAIARVHGTHASISIVPVRMTEAWFLFDVPAIRQAADNPNGRVDLGLPPLRKLEDLPDPKRVLEDVIVEASETRGRKRTKFLSTISRRKHVVALRIADFARLRALSAFASFENRVRDVLYERNWTG